MNEQVAGHPQSITRKWQKSQKNSLAKKYKKLKGKNKNYFSVITCSKDFATALQNWQKWTNPCSMFLAKKSQLTNIGQQKQKTLAKRAKQTF